MKLSLFLSASATLVLAAAGADKSTFAELNKSIKSGGGIKHLAKDGVLRSLNPARDTVVDYIQLDKRQIAEYLAAVNQDASSMAGVDGRAVTSEAQLWAVPDGIVPRTPNAKSSKNKRVPRALFAGRQNPPCVEETPCQEDEDCYEYNCAECVQPIPVPAPCNLGACPPVAEPNGACFGQL